MDLVRLLKIVMYFYVGRETFFFLLIPAIVYIVLLVMGGFGLYRMAARKGLKFKARAFIPFANSYLLGQLAGDKCAFFGARIKLIKLWVMLTEILAFLVGGLSVICTMALYTDMFADVRYIRETLYGSYYDFNVNAMTVTQKTLYYGYYVGQWVYYFFELFYILFFFTAAINLFRSYAPAQATIFSLVSIFLPIENIFIFAVSGNKEVNYTEYIRARYARYRNQANYYNRRPPYGGGGQADRSKYNYDPYTGKPINHNNTSDNSAASGDPFPEFGGDNKNGGSSSSSSDNSSGGSSDNSSGNSSGDSSNPFDL